MFNFSKMSRYRRKLFYNFFLLFIAFAIAIAGFQYLREKSYRVGQLENELITYINLTNEYLRKYDLVEQNQLRAIDSLISIIPSKEVRLTVVKKDGLVIYDSFVDDFERLENHIDRPELQQSLLEVKGASIRYSTSTNRDYYYCAINFNEYFVRAALPYDIHIENFLKVDVVSIYVIFFIFVIASLALVFMSDKLGKTITKLQIFASKAAAGKNIDIDEKFPNNELGMIGNEIVQVYNRLQKTKNELSAEREKLFRHLQISHEGIAVFNQDKKQILVNNHFIQYLNSLSDDLAVAPNKVFKIKDLKPINKFIDEELKKAKLDNSATLSSNMITVQKNNKYFVVQAIVFNDFSFEISINDVTKLEKEKKLKQHMTSNIAHELKTPVSSILGYLETLLDSKVDEETSKLFLERSYVQSQRLASLIQDLSLLNKIEEASELFQILPINVKSVVANAVDDLKMKMSENDISLSIDLSDDLNILGNQSVFFSIWRNLIENAVNYSGKGSTIRIKKYLEDDQFLYFSFSDNGTGVDEKHLTRMFERFYRVDSGRARSMGGTGLGLAIVKNGVVFHKGEISVKKPKGGGLEFIFSISKDSTAVS